jgi:hypothetical protein
LRASFGFSFAESECRAVLTRRLLNREHDFAPGGFPRSGVTKREEFLGRFLGEEELQRCATLENYWLRARSSPRWTALISSRPDGLPGAMTTARAGVAQAVNLLIEE